MLCPEYKQSFISGLDTFTYTEYKMQDIENNRGPENNLLIKINKFRADPPYTQNTQAA